MDIGGINRKPNQLSSEPGDDEVNEAGLSSVVFSIKKKKVKVKRNKIKKHAKEVADLAESIGETNDPEHYAEDLTDTLMEAYKEMD